MGGGAGAAYTEFAPGLKQYPRTISTNNFHEQYPLLKQLPNHPRWSTQIIINVSAKCNPSVSFFIWNISYRKPILCGVLLVISCPRDTRSNNEQYFSRDFSKVIWKWTPSIVGRAIFQLRFQRCYEKFQTQDVGLHNRGERVEKLGRIQTFLQGM